MNSRCGKIPQKMHKVQSVKFSSLVIFLYSSDGIYLCMKAVNLSLKIDSLSPVTFQFLNIQTTIEEIISAMELRFVRNTRRWRKLLTKFLNSSCNILLRG